MIRVLQVFAQMDRGGSETMIMNYYRHINRDNIQFDFVVHTTKRCAFDDEIEQLGGRIFHLPRFKGYNYFQYKKAWKRLFDANPEFQIIHVHFFTIAGAILPVAKECNIPVRIEHCHIADPRYSIIHRMGDVILRYKAIKNATDFFACSEEAGHYFFGNLPFSVIKNAIDIRQFSFNATVRNKLRNELNISNQFVIGHIGRFEEQKNHRLIIDILAEVSKLNKNSILLLIGDGSLKENILEKCDSLGLKSKVIFTGVRTDIPQLLQAMDVFLFPSLFEGLGIVAIEAQAAGLHTIVSDKVPEEVHITPFIERISLDISPNAWAEKILQYNNNYVREDTFNDICKAGYDIKNNATELEKFYNSKIN